jgi:hypothetical protein
MDPWLEEKRLENRRQKASQKRRPVETARCCRGTPQGLLALGQGAGHAENERADGLARAAIKTLRG